MAQRRFLPAQGDAKGLSHYFELIGDFAERAGVATPMLDRAVELYQRCIDMGLGEHDNAVMVDVIGSMPRAKRKKPEKAVKKAKKKIFKMKQRAKKPKNKPNKKSKSRRRNA